MGCMGKYSDPMEYNTVCRWVGIFTILNIALLCLFVWIYVLKTGSRETHKVPPIQVGPVTPGFLRIFVKTLDGQITPLELRPQDTVLQIKKKFQEQTGVIPQSQRLFREGKQLKDDYSTIQELYMPSESTLQILISRTAETSQ